MNKSTRSVSVEAVTQDGSERRPDFVATEEPLEIRIDGRPIAITMRTPGNDLELVAGFLFTEGVIDGPDDVQAMAHVDDPSDPQGNTVDTVLAAGLCMAYGTLSMARPYDHACQLPDVQVQQNNPEIQHADY